MSVTSFAELLSHVEHNLEVVTYGDGALTNNVAIECLDCNEVILDFDNPDPTDGKPNKVSTDIHPTCPECDSSEHTTLIHIYEDVPDLLVVQVHCSKCHIVFEETYAYSTVSTLTSKEK